MISDRSLVYRLENAQGRGPFIGEQVGQLHFLRHFKNITEHFEELGLPMELASVLIKLGFVWGWTSREHYREFFTNPQGRWEAKRLGYRCRVYQPEFSFTLPDGQVAFLKPAQNHLLQNHPVLALGAFGEILKALSYSPIRSSHDAPHRNPAAATAA